jgi:hypothetical protein
VCVTKKQGGIIGKAGAVGVDCLWIRRAVLAWLGLIGRDFRHCPGLMSPRRRPGPVSLLSCLRLVPGVRTPDPRALSCVGCRDGAEPVLPAGGRFGRVSCSRHAAGTPRHWMQKAANQRAAASVYHACVQSLRDFTRLSVAGAACTSLEAPRRQHRFGPLPLQLGVPRLTWQRVEPRKTVDSAFAGTTTGPRSPAGVRHRPASYTDKAFPVSWRGAMPTLINRSSLCGNP